MSFECKLTVDFLYCIDVKVIEYKDLIIVVNSRFTSINCVKYIVLSGLRTLRFILRNSKWLYPYSTLLLHFKALVI